LRQLLAFFILISFVAQTFSQAFVVAGYYINTDAFAKNCENKGKPKIKCNGKCQMMKKLKQEEKKDQQNPERKSNYKNPTISSKSFFATIDLVQLSSGVLYPSYNPQAITGRICDIFHPPRQTAAIAVRA
jgi:hypothetical protein